MLTVTESGFDKFRLRAAPRPSRATNKAGRIQMTLIEAYLAQAK